MKIVLLHGKDTDPSQKWYPWLREETTKLGYEFVVPVLPKASDPIMTEWLVELEKTKPDQNTILIGHSRGGVAILRWLEKQPDSFRVKRVILVAANSGKIQDKSQAAESNFGFYSDFGYDFEAIRKHCADFVVLHSEDDPWVPFSAGEDNARGLEAKFLKFKDRGHFGKLVKTVPEILTEVIRD